MSPDDTHKMERKGVDHVRSVVNDMGCEFTETREKYEALDGIIELRRRGKLTGQCIGVEIKSGRSYVSSETESRFNVRVLPEHVSRWGKLTLPVIFIWYDPKSRPGSRPGSRHAYWTQMSSSTDDATTIIALQKNKKFTRHSKGELIQLAREFFKEHVALPLLRLRSSKEWVPLSQMKTVAWRYYQNWRKEGCDSPAFGKVLLTRRAWKNLTNARQSQRAVVRRLELLPVAREVLSKMHYYTCCRRKESKGSEPLRQWFLQKIVLREPHRGDGVIFIVTEKIGDDPVRFCSVYEERSRRRRVTESGFFWQLPPT